MALQPGNPQWLLRITLEIPSVPGLAPVLADGSLALPLVLQNCSAFPAQLPFLCVMDLGLSLAPQHDWKLDKIASDGRKLVRASFSGTLMPGERVRAGALMMNVVSQDGLRVSFNAGPPAPIDGLKDLRLFAVSGAANFPAERGYLTLSADDLRRRMTQAQAASPAAIDRLAG